MLSSTSKSKHRKRNWLELPFDLTFDILNRLGIVDKLENAQKVCTAWCKICKDPALWRVINMKDLLMNLDVEEISTEEMCKHAVDRSQGQLVDITIMDACNADLLLYVADRSSQLRRLEICSALPSDYIHIRWNEVLMKFPLLEELSLDSMNISKEAIETAGHCCPLLKTLSIRNTFCSWSQDANDQNQIATTIGENLHELRHLQLIEDNLSNIGLQVILDGCPHLETLDLSRCSYIDPKGDIWRRCSQQIKHVIWPCFLFQRTRYDYGDDSSDSFESNGYDYGDDSPDAYGSPESYDGYISE